MKKSIVKIISAILCVIMLFSVLPASLIAGAVDVTGTVFLYGDTDLNGEVNSVDALIDLRHSIELDKLYGVRKAAGDVDLNPGIDANDALYVLKLSIGLLKQFAVGVTGKYLTDDISDFGYEDISYDTTYETNHHWCYKQLTSAQQKAYDRIINAAVNYEADLVYVGNMIEGVDINDAKVAYQAVIRDNPWLFWLPSAYLLSRDDRGRVYVAMEYDDGVNTVHYIYSYAFIKQNQINLGYAVNVAFNQALKPGMTEGERALALHNWLTDLTTYDNDSVRDLQKYPEALSAYKALINETAVCEGLSKAYQLLLFKCGIDCICVVSDYHMWNEVCIDGEWYYTDITWDDNDGESYPYYFSYNQTYQQILLSHPTMSKILKDFSHVSRDGLPYDWNYNLPNATAIKENWFVKNRLYYENWKDFEKNFPARLAEAIRDGDRDIQFMVKGIVINSFNDYSKYLKPAIDAANQINNNYELWIRGYQYSHVSDGCGAILMCTTYGD